MAILQRVSGSSSVIDPGIGSIIVLVDTASASWTALDTIFLPAAPKTFCQVTIKDATGSADAKPIAIDFAGRLADGGGSEILQIPYGSRTCIYNGTGWCFI